MKVMDELEKFNKEVKEAGGEFSVTSLLPRPSEVDKKCSSFKEKVRNFASKRFKLLNQKIYRFNKVNDGNYLNLKQYLEVKSKKNKNAPKGFDTMRKRNYYPGFEQKRIVLNSYVEDWIHLKPKVQERLLEICCNSRSLQG